ncbi:MAG: hypothetical protein L0G94_10715 [Brachybacterium sp.]|uniref:hypothetical protein n=1 Tax=Brachybacterium sp. TaxID=1891286 RepID=UPI002647A93B|nr:hypothetical protein [Brachybacterium sp.]MDN5687128.1 hypothetical protein [Brachybacterium sp.]
MDVFDLRDACIEALAHLDVTVTAGEPGTPFGTVEQTVIIGVTPGLASLRRAAGGSVDRDGYVNALVVTASRDSCLWLTQRVRDALADFPLGSPHGRLTDASYDGEPVPEPDTSPARWSRALAFTITTKRR